MGRATCPSRFVSRYDELPRRPIRSARYSGESEFGFSQFRTLQRIGDISEDDLKGCMTSKTPSLFQEGIRFQDGTLQTTAAISGSGNIQVIDTSGSPYSVTDADIGNGWLTFDVPFPNPVLSVSDVPVLLTLNTSLTESIIGPYIIAGVSETNDGHGNITGCNVYIFIPTITNNAPFAGDQLFVYGAVFNPL